MSTHIINVNADELVEAMQPALIEAMERLVGNKTIPVQVFCDVLISLLADTLVAAPAEPKIEKQIDHLTLVFRAKLLAAMGLPHKKVVGHA